MMHVEAKTFSNAAELIEHRKALRAKLFPRRVVNRAHEIIKAKEEREAHAAWLEFYAGKPAPYVRPDEEADEHVKDYRRWLSTLGAPKRRFIEELAREDGFTISQIMSKTRVKKIVHARQRYMWEVKRRWPDISYPELGRLFGGKDHTTAIHAVKMHNKRIDADEKISVFKRVPPAQFQSGVVGVNWNEKAWKWYVTIWHKGKRHHVGHYTHMEEAIEAQKAYRETLNA